MKVVLFANTDWYLFNFRRSLAAALRDAGHEVLLVSPPGLYGDRLRELGFRWEPAPMQRRSLNPFRELGLVIWLWRLMKEEKPDLVHGFTIKCAVYGSLAARLSGTPARVNAVAGMGYVFTSYSVKARLLRPVVRALMRLALDGAGARLILQNPDDLRLFEESALVPRARMRLIPGSGVDTVRFFPSPAPPPHSEFRVLLPARLLWDKGLAEYIEAAQILKRDGRPIHFMLAGEPDPGNPAAVSRERVQSWVDEGIVQWLGHVDNMPDLFRSVNAVVLPSYREGFPKGLIEAAACGLPIVTTDVPGCRDVVTHGVDGLIVPARSGRALAAAIAQLHDNEDLCIRFSHAARVKALRLFDERIVIGRTLAVYQELLPGDSSLASSVEPVH
jgi:glycosyltransferase involved in cell wall biosynthesis